MSRGERDLKDNAARKPIGVFPPTAATSRVRLFGVLEAAFPVSFKASETAEATGFDGLLVLDAAAVPEAMGDAASGGTGSPRLICMAAETAPLRAAEVSFAEDSLLARPLRGRALSGEAQIATVLPAESARVLARTGRSALWWASPEDGCQVSTCSPVEISDGEALRDQLQGERFMGLIPLIHFLREVSAELDWEPQPLRASFVIDDPNLHRPSYGHLHYAELIGHAIRHGYHVGFATVPLDGWASNSRAASLIRENPRALSLMMHGNDHISGELGRLSASRQSEIVLAQALRRIERLERRSGVTVQRIMVPPHEACSMSALKAMASLGYEAACIGRRHPWGEQERAQASRTWPLLRWHPADMIDGALAVLPRYLIDRPRQELVLRALLRQPLILFGHHADFADGLDAFADAAGYVNGLGEVEWGPLSTIAQQNALRRQSGETLTVQLHSRRVIIEIPQGVRVLKVTMAGSWGERTSRLSIDGEAHEIELGTSSSTVARQAVTPGERLALELTAAREVNPHRVALPKSAPWAGVRRALVEARDRLMPISHRLRGL